MPPPPAPVCQISQSRQAKAEGRESDWLCGYPLPGFSSERLLSGDSKPDQQARSSPQGGAQLSAPEAELLRLLLSKLESSRSIRH